MVVFHEHPAVSSVGWIVVLCWVSYVCSLVFLRILTRTRRPMLSLQPSGDDYAPDYLALPPPCKQLAGGYQVTHSQTNGS